ncbi:hypothetical protein ACVWYF_003998 [Hymenobacter sp. UYAg731]
MTRRKFWLLGGGAVLAAGAATEWLVERRPAGSVAAPANAAHPAVPLLPDEQAILHLAAQAPSGHNAQPWLVTRQGPFRWVIGNDPARWLMAVDPTQRETMLSLGAFLQTLEYAAAHYGYACRWMPLAASNQAADVAAVVLTKTVGTPGFDVAAITSRCTVHTGYRNDALTPDDIRTLTAGEPGIYYIGRGTPEYQWLDAQTLAANHQQTYRDPAERELSHWMRFSDRDAARHRDGLTPASLGLDGVAGWWVRHFYTPATVMTASFRERGLKKAATEVGQGAGWLVLTSPNRAPATLFDAGRRVQRLWLRVRTRGIGLHPMSQILEEAPFAGQVNGALGLAEPIQFLLRCGYVDDYPDPVSERRPVAWFVHAGAAGPATA